jgi:penicillin-binding protein-related factor A (putative recombinase)
MKSQALVPEWKENKAREKEIENSILYYLSHLPECFVWKNNSTGIYDPVKKIFRKSSNKWVINGVSDIIGIYKGMPIFIEVKTPKTKNRLSIDQKFFLEKVIKMGGIGIVATSVDDVIAQLPD